TAIFGDKRFNFPRPSALIQYLVGIATITTHDAIILDSFAGSGTTAHAVLNMNKADGGNRRFILVEMEDYADSITAERVRRVISGYGSGKSAVKGTGGSFSFYELGEPLMIDDELNEAVGTEKIREYVWFMETRQAYNPAPSENPFLLGVYNDTAWYFYYKPSEITTLDFAFLSNIRDRADHTVIYADRCAISEKRLDSMGITFKKIPRDIARL
ncbi:MAG: site-specific DNA-methyltransferase, partial [Abditibacteriota bacterium]|nr:site-specific DNA-methyltransferase [Abditibacteriota bacterium]